MAQSNTNYAKRTTSRIGEPKQYAVVLLNDDFTTMELVMYILENVFFKSEDEAYRLMMTVHVEGRGVAGVYPLDIARSKVSKVMTLAREEGAPLKVIMEEV